MKTIILDTIKNTITVEDIEDTLDNWYEKLYCNTIDIVVRNIGGKDFDIICDDEGLLKPNSVSMIGKNMKPMLVGSIGICNSEEGELKPLSDEDVSLILENVFGYVEVENIDKDELIIRKAIKSEDIAW